MDHDKTTSKDATSRISAGAAKVADNARITIVCESERSAVLIGHPSKQEEDDGYGRYVDEKYLSGVASGTSYQLIKRTFFAPSAGHLLQRYFVSRGWDGNTGKEAGVELLRSLCESAEELTSLDGVCLALQPTIQTTAYYNAFKIMIAYCQSAGSHVPGALLDILHYCGISSYDQYVEQTSNGLRIVVAAFMGRCYEGPLCVDRLLPLITHGVFLAHCLPESASRDHLRWGRLSMQETTYAHCVSRFCSHFLHRREHGQAVTGKRLHAAPEEILAVIHRHPDVVRSMYLQFAATHYCGSGLPDDVLHTAMAQQMQVHHGAQVNGIENLIRGVASDDFENLVLSCFSTFNSAVLATNFFLDCRAAVSFRLDPDFLSLTDCPDRLHGMFFVCGANFCGLHLRLRDVSRGGIRLVISQTEESYKRNAERFFEENYGLAQTQNRKNKDIAEGGAKGVILLDFGHSDRAEISFKAYIASILDLIVPPTDTTSNRLVNLYGKAECLFMGPDENTAGYVDWATEYARERGAAWWRSFFSGKSPRLGGIPHDTHGMTTLSVRQYVKGIYEKTGRNVGVIRKMQTGGPDGDLGSNEILQSLQSDGMGEMYELYVAIVDGSGVLADPNGLNREELLRLARARLPIAEYNRRLLSPLGYCVLLSDENVTLPTGELVADGVKFRDTFHLRHSTRCDLFVPCGGRPKSIDLAAAESLIVDGRCAIPCIVEGANLFMTQEARLLLEQSGCIVFKDASVNKGGVISSSFEVLAALCFTDDEFVENMCVAKDGVEPLFYKRYVEQVKEIIRTRARLEFNALWEVRKATGQAHSVIADDLSRRILLLSEEVKDSSVWSDMNFQRSVLEQAIPSVLVEKIGFWKLVERVSPDQSDERATVLTLPPVGIGGRELPAGVCQHILGQSNHLQWRCAAG